MMKRAIAGLVLVAWASAVWFAALWANYRNHLPQWSLFVIAAAVIALVAVAFRVATRSHDTPDALERWREFCVVRDFALHADETHSCTLTLELARQELAGRSVRLRFRGVRKLRMTQFGDQCLAIELRCDDLGARTDGVRYRVRAHDTDTFGFFCRSFEQCAA